MLIPVSNSRQRTILQGLLPPATTRIYASTPAPSTIAKRQIRQKRNHAPVDPGTAAVPAAACSIYLGRAAVPAALPVVRPSRGRGVGVSPGHRGANLFPRPSRRQPVPPALRAPLALKTKDRRKGWYQSDAKTQYLGKAPPPDHGPEKQKSRCCNLQYNSGLNLVGPAGLEPATRRL